MRRQRNVVRTVQIAAIIAGVAFIALGAARGEIAVVLRKAVFVCLECIGVVG